MGREATLSCCARRPASAACRCSYWAPTATSSSTGAAAGADLRQLVRERLGARHPLGGSPRRPCRDARALARPPPRLCCSALYATEGNPFFVEEVFQHLPRRDALRRRRTWRKDLAVEDLDVPEGVRLVVGRRLERLRGCRRALTAAAVVGRSFDYDLLAAIGDLEGEALAAAVEEAERLRLIQTCPSGRSASRSPRN